MTSDDAFDDREANSCSRELVRTMQALEDAKQLADVFHIETDPIVRNDINSFTALDMALDFDKRLWIRSGVFDGIVQQVGKNLLDHGNIGLNFWKCAYFELNGAADESRLKLLVYPDSVETRKSLLRISFPRILVVA